MSRPENRGQLMERLGATQANAVWSWCGINEKERKIYFSVWEDHVEKVEGKPRYLVQSPAWGIDDNGHRSPARNDQDEKLRLVFEEGYEPYGYFIVAVDPDARPRQIASIRTSFVMRLRLDRSSDSSVYGTPLERIAVE